MSTLIAPSDVHRYSIEDYHRLIEIGAFEDTPRVELIDGYIVDMSPRSPQHENAIRWLHDWLIDHVDRTRFELLVTGSLTIGSSEPEPDLAIIDRAPPRLAHPSRARLIIEVALSSQDRDLRAKPAVYAPVVEEYWVVDLDDSCVVVHREPGPDGYGEVTVVPRGETIGALSVELGAVPTDALFAFAFAE